MLLLLLLPAPPLSPIAPRQDARLIDTNCQLYCGERFPALPPLAGALVAAMEAALAAGGVAEELAAAEREAAAEGDAAAAAAAAANDTAAAAAEELPAPFTVVLRLHKIIPGSTYAVPGALASKATRRALCCRRAAMPCAQRQHSPA